MSAELIVETMKKKRIGIAIAIDLKDAFDNLIWSQITSSLQKMGVESEYFQLVKLLTSC